jgi:hypothetical protein
VKFSRNFYRTAAACSVLSAATTLLLILLPSFFAPEVARGVRHGGRGGAAIGGAAILNEMQAPRRSRTSRPLLCSGQ